MFAQNDGGLTQELRPLPRRQVAPGGKGFPGRGDGPVHILGPGIGDGTEKGARRRAVDRHLPAGLHRLPFAAVVDVAAGAQDRRELRGGLQRILRMSWHVRLPGQTNK